MWECELSKHVFCEELMNYVWLKTNKNQFSNWRNAVVILLFHSYINLAIIHFTSVTENKKKACHADVKCFGLRHADEMCYVGNPPKWWSVAFCLFEGMNRYVPSVEFSCQHGHVLFLTRWWNRGLSGPIRHVLRDLS